MRFLKTLRDKLFNSLLTSSEQIEMLEEDLEDLEKENSALWSRMVALEVERQNHDGTAECDGCDSAVARALDDFDIDCLIPGGSLREVIKEVLREELND